MNDIQHAIGQADFASLPTIHAVAGVSSIAFKIAVLPHTSAEKIFQATFVIGVFAAQSTLQR
ncbi:MAG: hypothetical protein U0V48_11500 [Anaerolineales bacterium]